jgi:hypothetical protein
MDLTATPPSYHNSSIAGLHPRFTISSVKPYPRPLTPIKMSPGGTSAIEPSSTVKTLMTTTTAGNPSTAHKLRAMTLNVSPEVRKKPLTRELPPTPSIPELHFTHKENDLPSQPQSLVKHQSQSQQHNQQQFNSSNLVAQSPFHAHARPPLHPQSTSKLRAASAASPDSRHHLHVQQAQTPQLSALRKTTMMR